MLQHTFKDTQHTTHLIRIEEVTQRGVLTAHHQLERVVWGRQL